MVNAKRYVKSVIIDGVILAIFISHEILNVLNKTTVFTPWEWVIQVGYNIHCSGDVVKPHYHARSKSSSDDTAIEALYVISGKVKVHLFHPENCKYVDSFTLEKGDLIIMKCGHMVEYLEKSILLQVKEGPYSGEKLDKCYMRDILFLIS